MHRIHQKPVSREETIDGKANAYNKDEAETNDRHRGTVRWRLDEHRFAILERQLCQSFLCFFRTDTAGTFLTNMKVPATHCRFRTILAGSTPG